MCAFPRHLSSTLISEIVVELLLRSADFPLCRSRVGI
nr:MAG TPA: hypothetical protein [Caudoviricetes sp.]